MQATMRNSKGYSLAPSAQGNAIAAFAFQHCIVQSSAIADVVSTK